ncbi:uncharacterized protein LOC134802585 [Cydia splendana]|uniref:uncharacterized protein LOC134802585 n=1 Tax=Cydia splendana TaxID=1100963 RepID=UPI00300DB9E8
MEKEDDDTDETAGKTRFPVLPSLISLQQMRNRLATAQSGRRLMQWSAMATGAELRRIAKELGLVYVAFTDEVRNAFIVLARCRYFYPNVNKMVLENPPKAACVTVGRSTKSIAGCRIALYGIEDNCPDSYPFLGIDKGGEVIAEAKRTWHELLRKMIFIEQLRSNFMSLDRSHDQTNKKAKVLGKIIIPRTQVTIRYILSELEELEREEFFRLKKVLEVKYRHKKKNKPGDEEAVQVSQVAEVPEVRKEVIRKEVIMKEVCVVCGGPHHPSQPLTDQASIEIKRNIEKLLSATENYEKTAKAENLKDFKRTAVELKNILRTPPSRIPDDIYIDQLCDLCRQMYYNQLPTCVVCGEPIIPTTALMKVKQRAAILKNKSRKQPTSIPDNVTVEQLCDLCKDVYHEQHKCIQCGKPLDMTDASLKVAAKESRKLLIGQLETLLGTIKKYESEGRQGNEVEVFKENAAELKKKLEGRPIDMDKLCSYCIEQMTKPVPIPVIKVPSTCAVCHGPIAGMDENLRIAAKDSRKQLLNQLEALLLVTKKYESEGREPNEIKEFKQTADALKKKLQGPPIPKDVNIDTLCPDCKDRMRELDIPMPKSLTKPVPIPVIKVPSICAVCHGPIAGMDENQRIAAKESRKQLLNQLEALLILTKQYESEGREPNEIKEFKQTADALKKKLQGPPIPKDVNIDTLCPDCKDRMREPGIPMPKSPTPKASKVSIKTPPTASKASSEVSSDLQLGVFETEEITEVIQVKNPDGTVSEKRRVITIKRKPKEDDKDTGSGTSSFKDRQVGHVSVIHDRKGLMRRLPGDAQSEYTLKPLPMVDGKVRVSRSSSFCRYDDILQGFTELAPRENSDGTGSNDSSITHSRKEDKTDEKDNDSSLDYEMSEN